MGSEIVPLPAPFLKALRQESFLMLMMRMRSHQGAAFKRVRARGGRERSILQRCETPVQNTKTRLTPPSKTIPSGAPFLKAPLGVFFNAYIEFNNEI